MNPDGLLPGTYVGPWRIVDLRGSGTYGAVYLAQGDAGFVALKLALKPWDRRFAREVELLSRLQSALGVTAYRLVTLRYPPTADPLDEGGHVWLPEGNGPQPARELNPRCCLELSQLISRMLSRNPKARGSAGELAEALEQAAREAGPETDASLFAPSVEVEATSRHITSEVSRSGQRSALAVAALVMSVIWVLGTSVWKNFAEEEARDAGPVAVGDSALTGPMASVHEPSDLAPITLDLPSKPFRGQIRPDANGRCPRKTMTPINGGCWIETKVDPKDCEKASYVHKGRCYEPAVPLPPPATSSPAQCPDGG